MTFPDLPCVCWRQGGSSSSPLATLHCDYTPRPALITGVACTERRDGGRRGSVMNRLVGEHIHCGDITYSSPLHVISLLMMDKLSNTGADLNYPLVWTPN